MTPSNHRFALWSLDWEDNHLKFQPPGRFLESSWALHELLAEYSGGKATWFAKADFVSDITDHEGLDRLAEEIVAAGGEIGLHTHFFSWEPYWRERTWKRALRSLRERWGIRPSSYGSGMGNYLASDTRALMDLGFKGGRLVYPWLKHEKESYWDAPYYGLAGMNMLDCQLGIRSGYLDPEDFSRHINQPTLVNFPQARLPEYRETQRYELQLGLGVTPVEFIDQIFEYAQTRTRYLVAYTHPAELLNQEGKIRPQAMERVAHLARLLRAEGYQFVTSAEACDHFSRLGELQETRSA